MDKKMKTKLEAAGYTVGDTKQFIKEVLTQLTAWTDYPIIAKGDIPQQEAPIRECIVLSYDYDKYCKVQFPSLDNYVMSIKAGYLYTKPGRCCEVPSISRKVLQTLSKTKWE